MILPLQNGVQNYDIIQRHYPNSKVLQGCTYIVSSLKSDGMIECKGNIQKIFFGLDDVKIIDRLKELELIFNEAGIDAVYSTTIATVVWEKFIFISVIATATSYFNKSIGEILITELGAMFIHHLINEVCKVAQSKKILLSDNIESKIFDKIKLMPFETTSSMHLDFKKNKSKTELASLTEYVINEAKLLNLEVRTFNTAYTHLSKKVCENSN
jgi:2-dehydropantoate 2-reductase